MYEYKLNREHICPLEYGLKLFSGKWKTRVVCFINQRGVVRFRDIKESIAEITEPVLAATLKELQQDELIQKKQYDEVPLRVEYSITEKCASVIPIMQALCSWSEEYTDLKNRGLEEPCRSCFPRDDRKRKKEMQVPKLRPAR